MFHQHQPLGPRPGFVPPWAAFFGRRRHHGPEADGPGWGRPPFGPFARRGRFPGRGPNRLFERGDLKYVILDLLREQPRHGYDVIRALEERFRGLYSPSPGSVYPTLQLLEDQGYVSSSQQDGKKVYAVTDEGRRFLEERAATLEGIRARTSAGWGGGARAEQHALMAELRDLAGVLFRHGAHRAIEDREKIHRLRGVVARARTEIEAILDDGTTSSPSTL